MKADKIKEDIIIIDSIIFLKHSKSLDNTLSIVDEFFYKQIT